MMTVQELIESLQSYHPQATVTNNGYEGVSVVGFKLSSAIDITSDAPDEDKIEELEEKIEELTEQKKQAAIAAYRIGVKAMSDWQIQATTETADDYKESVRTHAEHISDDDDIAHRVEKALK